jgi:cell division protein FtsN
MKSKKPQAKKKKALLWILLGVAVLLAGGFGLFTQLDSNAPAPVVMSAVVRVKIPPAPASTALVRAEQPSIQPQTGQEDTGTDIATDNSSDMPPSGPGNTLTDVGHKIADRTETDNNMPTPPGISPIGSGENDMDKSEPLESSGNQTAGTGPSASMTTATDEPQSNGPLASDGRQASDLVASPSTPAQQTESDPASRSTALEDTKAHDDPDHPAPFTIQVGAYLTKAYADKTVSQLMDKGYDAYIFQRTDKKQRPWYLVRFGHFSDRVTAVQALTNFKDQERMEASIALSNSI